MKFKLLFLLLPFLSFAQEDLLSEIDTIMGKQTVTSAFKALKIVNLESTKLAAKGDLYFIVAHRFGSVKDGFEGFYGLDNANTQIKFLYGLKDGNKCSLSFCRHITPILHTSFTYCLYSGSISL